MPRLVLVSFAAVALVQWIDVVPVPWADVVLVPEFEVVRSPYDADQFTPSRLEVEGAWMQSTELLTPFPTPS